MSSFICIVAICPVRYTASHRAEQVSQLLFGECCEELAEEDDFVHVKCVYDGYVGWCQKTQLAPLSAGLKQSHIKLASNHSNSILCNGVPMPIYFGSDVSIFVDNEIQLGQLSFTYKGNYVEPAKMILKAADIEAMAYLFLHTSYLWGGRSVFGIDCSGFTQIIYACFNVPLLRDASLQAAQGEGVGFLQEAKCGDLAFFDNDEGIITHVGILLNANTIIHASGKVRIDAIDNEGIINDEGKRTHKLRIIKRVAEY